MALTIRSGKYTSYLDGLCAIGFYVLLWRGIGERKRIHVITLLPASYAMFMLARGLLSGNPVTEIAPDTISILGVFLPLVASTRFLERLLWLIPRFLWWSVLAGIPIFFVLYRYMGYRPGSIETVRFDYDPATHLVLFAPTVLLEASLFLVFFHFGKRNDVKLSVLILAIGLIAFMGLVTLSVNRFYSIGASILCYLVLVRKRPLFTIAGLSLVSAVFLAPLVLSKSSGAFKASGASLVGRVEDGATGLVGRTDEQSDYLGNATATQILLGRGLGGLKINRASEAFIGSPGMMHFGWAHLLLKGGIAWVAIVYGMGVFSVVRLWRTSFRPYSVYIVFIFLSEPVHTHWMSFIGTALFWVVVAFAARITPLQARVGTRGLLEHRVRPSRSFPVLPAQASNTATDSSRTGQQ